MPQPKTLSEALCRIRQECGVEFLKDSGKLSAVFSDIAPDLKAERAQVSVLCSSGCVKNLSAGAELSLEEAAPLIASAVDNLCDNYLMDRAKAEILCRTYVNALHGELYTPEDPATDDGNQAVKVEEEIIKVVGQTGPGGDKGIKVVGQTGSGGDKGIKVVGQTGPGGDADVKGSGQIDTEEKMEEKRTAPVKHSPSASYRAYVPYYGKKISWLAVGLSMYLWPLGFYLLYKKMSQYASPEEALKNSRIFSKWIWGITIFWTISACAAYISVQSNEMLLPLVMTSAMIYGIMAFFARKAAQLKAISHGTRY